MLRTTKEKINIFIYSHTPQYFGNESGLVTGTQNIFSFDWLYKHLTIK